MKTKFKKGISIIFAAALTVTTVFTGNGQNVSAEDATAKDQIIVYVGAQGKSQDGKEVKIGKTAVQVEEGTTADVAVKKVLEGSGYTYDLPDSGLGPYLEAINGMGTVQDGDNWYYWSFYINGNYSDVGLGSYKLQDNDKISLIYSYNDYSNVAECFADDQTKNPTEETAKALVENAKQQQSVLAAKIYEAKFAGGYIPGIEDTNALYTVFSLLRSGYRADSFYQEVYKKVIDQLYTLNTKGAVVASVGGKDSLITEQSLLDGKYAETNYAKIVLLLSAMGKDATNAGGMNLIEKMASRKVYEASSESYTTDATMLLAFDSKNYSLPVGKNYVTRTELVNNLVSMVDSEIGDAIAWGMVDMPAMVIQPLAAYVTENNLAAQENTGTFNADAVVKATKKVIQFIESMQAVNGYFGDSYSANNAWTLSQVMTTMGQFGIDATSEEDGSDFIKNGVTVYDAAGEFVDVTANQVADSLMSYQPEQLLRGFNALLRVSDKESGLYDMTAQTEMVQEITPEELQSRLPQTETVKVAKVTGLKVKAGKRKATVTWKTQSGMKYKVAYGTSKSKLSKLKNGKTKASGVTVVNAASAKKVLKKLKAKKTYYVKVCAYKTIDDKTTYGAWSSVKSAKIK